MHRQGPSAATQAPACRGCADAALGVRAWALQLLFSVACCCVLQEEHAQEFIKERFETKLIELKVGSHGGGLAHGHSWWCVDAWQHLWIPLHAWSLAVRQSVVIWSGSDSSPACTSWCVSVPLSVQPLAATHSFPWAALPLFGGCSSVTRPPGQAEC